MTVEDGCLVDTNILLRVSRMEDQNYPVIRDALRELDRRGARLVFTLQNVAEFWNVCTRDVDRNGYGLSAAEANNRVRAIERAMTLLPDNRRVYTEWRRLVVEQGVRGVQVHDARLAAAMIAHGVGFILTLNGPDFARFSGVRAMHPRELI